MMKKDSKLLSSDTLTELHMVEWIPKGEIKGTVQIVHGMVEFIDRYDRFGRFLSDNGYAVIGIDLLGHGESVKDKDSYGYFGKPDGNELLMEDIHKVRQYVEDNYKGKPHYILGHSMGSFLTEEYITRHGKGLAGAIISGTGYQSGAVVNAGLLITGIISLFRGDRYRSRFVNNMALGSNNKAFEPARTRNDWLTKDEEIVDRYNENPLNNFVFTLNGFKTLFRAIKEAHKKSNIDRIPKELKIFIISGEKDPVGNFGEGPRKLWEVYQKSGIEDMFIKLYEDDRHEVLNETDYMDVQNDILEWLEEE